MTTTGITITHRKVNGATRIEVQSEKLKTLKNAKYRNPIDDFVSDVFNNLFKSFGEAV